MYVKFIRAEKGRYLTRIMTLEEMFPAGEVFDPTETIQAFIEGDTGKRDEMIYYTHWREEFFDPDKMSVDDREFDPEDEGYDLYEVVE